MRQNSVWPLWPLCHPKATPFAILYIQRPSYVTIRAIGAIGDHDLYAHAHVDWPRPCRSPRQPFTD